MSAKRKKPRQHMDWVDVPDSVVRRFRDDVARLVRALPADWSDDPPVDVLVVDRRKFWPMHFAPVPYDHSPEKMTEEEADEVMRVRLINLRIASEQVQLGIEKRLDVQRVVQRRRGP